MSEQTRTRYGSAAEEIAEQISELHRRLVGYIDGQIAGLGLTLPQAFVLHQLDAPLAMSQVAERLHCDASNVTGIVDRLEARGLVERQVRAGDRRVKEIALTTEGRKVKRQVKRMLMGTPGIGELNSREQSALRDLLERALAGLR